MQFFTRAPENSERRPVPRILLVVGGWLAVIAAIQVLASWQMVHPLELVEQARELCATHPAGPLIFLGLALFSPFLLIPAALLGGLAGFCFGPVLGIIYTLIGCNLSALLTYTIGRISGHGSGRIAALCARYSQAIAKRPFWSVLMMRLSFLPYEPVNYLIGMLRVRLTPFLIANTLGSLPGVVAIVLAGSFFQ